MFEKIYSIFNSNSTNSRLLQMLIILAIIFIIITIYNRYYSTMKMEGFRQSDRYILKENQETYDEFYSQIYDDLMLSQTRAEYEVSQIVEMTEPSKQYSSFLDIGSGTGNMIHYLKQTGYTAYGIDKSKAMVAKSQQKFPNVQVKCGNAMEPITFDRATFTHILCVGLTIYEFENKAQLFKNSYFWLQPNGYLIIHLVDRKTFDTIIPGGKPTVIDHPQKYSENRITDTIIDFIDFKYKSTYDFSKENGQVVHKETFTDKQTQNVRENERVLYMENISDILSLAKKYGFIVKGKVDMVGKDGEHLYILERLM